MYCPIGYTLSNNALYDYKGGSGVDTFPGFAGSCDGRIDAGAGNDLFTVAAALDSKAVLNGDAGNDTFTFLTTAQNAVATFNGGADNDTFKVGVPLGTAVLDGGAGDADKLVLTANTLDLAGATIQNIEILDLTEAAVTGVTLNAAQFNGFSTVAATAGLADTISIKDAGNVNFTATNTGAKIDGSTANNQLVFGDTVTATAPANITGFDGAATKDTINVKAFMSDAARVATEVDGSAADLDLSGANNVGAIFGKANLAASDVVTSSTADTGEVILGADDSAFVFTSSAATAAAADGIYNMYYVETVGGTASVTLVDVFDAINATNDIINSTFA